MHSFVRRWPGNGSASFVVRNFTKKVPFNASSTAKNRQGTMEQLLDVALHSPPLHGVEMKVRSSGTVKVTEKDTPITTTSVEKLQQRFLHALTQRNDLALPHRILFSLAG